MKIALFFALGLVLVFLLLLGMAWRRQRLRRIRDDFTEFVSQVSEGDFKKRMIPFMQGDFDKLALEMNRMVEGLGKAMAALRGEKEFVANVSHDLKTPLTAIRGYAETLRRGALDDRATSLRFLEKIERNASHLERLVGDILVLAELDAEQFAVRTESFNIGVLVEQVIEEHRERAAVQGISLVSQYAPETMVIQANRAQLQQVLANLLENALTYTPRGGEVRVSLSEGPQGLRVLVADTGIGIPQTELPRIFDRFYRVDKARSKRSGGSGLGLAIVKQVVKLHGGSVSVESSLGKGTQFSITLPRFYKTVT